ncbi:MAG: RNA-binding protein (KH domain) [bacterium]|nr:MAG: RNA-binding protein (KH domain) [bacterium]
MNRNQRFSNRPEPYREPRISERPPARRRHRLKELLEFLTITLVDNKDDVVVTERERQGKFYYTIKVAKTDMGKLLGRGGKTIGTVRTLMRVAAAKADVDAIVDILEDIETS